jgi:hypothetical protein
MSRIGANRPVRRSGGRAMAGGIATCVGCGRRGARCALIAGPPAYPAAHGPRAQLQWVGQPLRLRKRLARHEPPGFQPAGAIIQIWRVLGIPKRGHTVRPRRRRSGFDTPWRSRTGDNAPDVAIMPARARRHRRRKRGLGRAGVGQCKTGFRCAGVLAAGKAFRIAPAAIRRRPPSSVVFMSASSAPGQPRGRDETRRHGPGASAGPRCRSCLTKIKSRHGRSWYPPGIATPRRCRP